MKTILLLIFVFTGFVSKAQTIDSIYVNLYTDSLKKGTYNYINVDGLLSNGQFLPLDNTVLCFTASAGKFEGNNLLVAKDFNQAKIRIKVEVRDNVNLSKEFDMYIKQMPDNERLKTADEIMNEIKQAAKKKH